MTVRFVSIFALVLAASLGLGVASGAVITLDPSARGWLLPVAPFNNGTSPSNNYFVGFCAGSCVSSTEHRDFFEFSIPSFGGTVIGARLLFDTVNVLTPDASETYQVTSIPTAFAFSDLGNGTVYGSRVYTTADTSTNQAITLNAAALTAIISGTTFEIGGRLTTLSGQTTVNEAIFSGSGLGSITRLEITTVPEPASWMILLAAGVGATALKRRRLSRKS